MTSLIETKLKKKLYEIYEILKTNNNTENLGILTGLSGISLFFFNYSRLNNDDNASEIGIELIKSCFNKINNEYNYPTYCSGIAGFGWLLEHLWEEDFLDFNNDKLLIDLEDYLLSKMNYDLQNNNHDFLHGGIGYGYYFLKRYKNTKSEDLKQKYKENILKIISYFDEKSEKEHNMIKWSSEFNSEKKNVGYNLSLCHGIPSIINFLCRLHKYEDFKPHVRNMIEMGVNYILSCKNKSETSTSIFPNSQTNNNIVNNNITNSRLAWCYGDLGIGITLWQAAKTLNNESLLKTSIEILIHSSHRIDLEDNLVKDAGLCHGAFGIALVFNRIFKDTNNEIFYKASIFWCNEGLKMASHKDGYAGYKKYLSEKDIWEKEISLLEGIAGIGLVIIEILNPSDSKWDECLMLS